MLGKAIVAGKIYAHKCDTCQGSIFALAINAGAVPLFLSCRNPECLSIAFLAPGLAVPDPRMVCWEWYEPDFQTRQQMKVDDPEQYLAVESGELALRPRNTPFSSGNHTFFGKTRKF